MPWPFSVDLYAILVVYAFSVFALTHYAQYVDHIRFLMLAILYLTFLTFYFTYKIIFTYNFSYVIMALVTNITFFFLNVIH